MIDPEKYRREIEKCLKLEVELREARAQIAAKDAKIKTIQRQGELYISGLREQIVARDAALAEARAQIAAKDAEIERLHKKYRDPREDAGEWPYWGNRPDGFDGPGGAE